MALPSQTDLRSPNEGRTHAQPRRRGLNRGVLLGAAALMLLGFAALVWVLRPKNGGVPAASQLERQSTVGLNTPTGSPITTPTTSPKPGAGTPASHESPGALTKALGSTPTAGPETVKPSPVDFSTPSSSDPTVSEPKADPNPLPVKPSTAGGQIPASAPSEEFRFSMDAGEKKLASGDLIGARSAFSRLLADSRASRGDQEALRTKLSRISEDLIFSAKPVVGDPLVEEYVVQSGDNPTKIARKRDLSTEPGLIARVNRVDPGKLKIGQKLKLLRGPFHAVVHKGDFRLDLFAGSPDDAKSWTFIRSFRVGLGENNSTPTGTFTVKADSKLVNPHWVNPRTGEKFSAGDAKNPIGERWIGIEGVGPSAVHTGFGLHGTIEPGSIGQQRSMGCVRLASEDVELLYDMLVEKISVVKIEP